MLLFWLIFAQPQVGGAPASQPAVGDDALVRKLAELKRVQAERLAREQAAANADEQAMAVHRKQVQAAWDAALPVIQNGGPEGKEALRLLRATYDNHPLGNPLAELMAAADGDNAEERAITMMEDMADLVQETQNNCDEMGDRLNKFMDHHRQTIIDIKAFSERQTAGEKKASEEKYKHRAAAAGKKMMGGVMKCMTNERVKAAMGKMKM